MIHQRIQTLSQNPRIAFLLDGAGGAFALGHCSRFRQYFRHSATGFVLVVWYCKPFCALFLFLRLHQSDALETVFALCQHGQPCLLLPHLGLDGAFSRSTFCLGRCLFWWRNFGFVGRGMGRVGTFEGEIGRSNSISDWCIPVGDLAAGTYILVARYAKGVERMGRFVKM